MNQIKFKFFVRSAQILNKICSVNIYVIITQFESLLFIYNNLIRIWVSVGMFIFRKTVFKLSYWRSLSFLSLKSRKSMTKLFERFLLALKITANQRDSVSMKPVS